MQNVNKDNYQRVGSISNSDVGRNFESVARDFFRQQDIALARQFSVSVGVESSQKNRSFDLGSDDPPILVECKSHRWTAGDNVPSAKMTVWNEAMFYFHLAPSHFRKVLFVLRHFSEKRGETLANYYVRNYGHLIPSGVELIEYDAMSDKVFEVPT